tara:strand:+ start:1801 stop:2805 length:1005 start_codon:yes stop_codon:yes gene_type:complete
VILKSYIVEKNINVLNEYFMVLIYGVNDGIKDDIKFKIKDLNKNAEITNFFEEEIIKNRNILFETVVNESLFNEKKIIFIHSATDKILNEISECIVKKDKNVKIYVFAENLDKKSKLRNLFEKEKKLAVFACYEDTDTTLISYINSELNEHVGLTGELINLIITNSSSNRKIIQSELIKIKNFFINKPINKNQLEEILNLKNNTGFNEIRDNTLMGRISKINKLLSETDILNEDSFYCLNSLNYRILKLVDIQKIHDPKYSYEKTLDKVKPPVFWKDKSIYLEQLKKWDLKKLSIATLKIAEAEILMRKNILIKKDIIIKNLIVSLSKEAATYS